MTLGLAMRSGTTVRLGWSEGDEQLGRRLQSLILATYEQRGGRGRGAVCQQSQRSLVDLLWDGGLTRGKVKITKEEQQKLYSKVLVGDQEDQGEDRPLEDCTHRPQEAVEEEDQNEDRPLEDYTLRLLEDCSLRLQEDYTHRPQTEQEGVLCELFNKLFQCLC
ncbi:hypothetical protein J4Q44_G00133730, partial [Coregonus suidteri]